MANGRQFKKGQSGNPAGKPKGMASLAKELKAIALEVHPQYGKTNIRLWAEAANRRALRGEPNTIEMILERLDGKVTQPIEANVNVSREKRLESIEELLTLLPAPADDDGSRDPRVN